ncbi:Ig domain-containing protein [Singulisphaera sp. PoT]|uniref:Ig domain-containing protein n=1 Tax=Singulisphaera sp. PoT TaxID=3411797 RepID=UPI003BF4E5CA
MPDIAQGGRLINAQGVLAPATSYAVGLSLNTTYPPLQVETSTFTKPVAGVPYQAYLSATGGAESDILSATISLSPDSPPLPDGLRIDYGQITGTATKPGTYHFVLRYEQVLAPNSVHLIGDTPVTLEVLPPPDETFTILPATLESAERYTPYLQLLTPVGSTGDVWYRLASGELPEGITVSINGQIGGVPQVTGTYHFVIAAQDSLGRTASIAYTLDIPQVQAGDLTITPDTIQSAQQGSAYSQQFTASGGTGDITYALTDGALPTGLTLSVAGKIGGTPTASGSFPFSVTATDAAGALTTKAFTLAVLPADPVGSLTLSPAEINAARQGEAYSQKIKATGGTGSVTFALTTGKLPAGLTLSQNGTIAGLPLVSGTFPISLTAKDSTGKTGSIAYSLVVKTAEPLSIAPTTLDAGQVGEDYSQILSVKSGAGAPTFAIIAGALPAGLILTQDGVIVGTPTIAGSFDFTVGVSRANGSSGSQFYTLDVQPAAVPIVVPPSVIDLARYGSNGGKSYLVVTYDREMDSTSAGWTGNYTLRNLGRDGIAGTRDDRIIPLVTATYASANHSVTLAPRGRLQLGNHRYQLVISSSVMSATGVRLDGNGSGVPGTSYTRTFGAEILRGKTPPTITPPGRTPTPRRHLGRGR